MKLPSPNVSKSGEMNDAVETSAKRPSFAPSARYHGVKYNVEYNGPSTSTLKSSSSSTYHFRSEKPPYNGYVPARTRPTNNHFSAVICVARNNTNERPTNGDSNKYQ